MNKSESKYFYTARLMNESLLILLEKKDIDYITVKEICEKAGVNRSTFYLHYDNIDDLFKNRACTGRGNDMHSVQHLAEVITQEVGQRRCGSDT